MENIKDIGKIVQELSQLGEAMKDVDFSAFNVVDRIKTEIAELKKEFNDFLLEDDFITSYGIEEITYDTLDKSKYGIEEVLYKEVVENFILSDFSYYSMEDIIDGIRDIKREYRNSRQKITLLERLLV